MVCVGDIVRRVLLGRSASLRWRITIGATAIVLFALLIVSLAVAGLLRRSLDRNTDELLTERVTAVESLITTGDLGPILDSTGREVGQVQVIDADGTVVSNTSGLADTTRFDVVAAPPVGQRTSATVKGDRIDNDPGEQYRLISSTVPTPEGALVVYAVTSLDASANAQSYLASRLLWALPLIGLVTGAVVFGVVGRALRPVDEMRRRVEEMSANDLTARLDVDQQDAELVRLATTMNGFLARLDTSAARQRLFAANASHELRSPLSALRTDLEVGLTYPERTDWQRTARDSLVEVSRLERLSRDLRSLTTASAISNPASLDVVALVRQEVDRRGDARVHFSCTGDTATSAIDRDGLVQVVRNLLDNAVRHASTAVEVAVDGRADGDVEIRIANDGPALAPADRERIFEPFVRLDEARSLDTGGSGLGLALSRSILQAAGGSVEAVECRQGAAFVVLLARSPSETST